MKRLFIIAVCLCAALIGYLYKETLLLGISPYITAQPTSNTTDAKNVDTTQNKKSSGGQGGGKRSGGPIVVAVAKAVIGSMPIARQSIGTVVPLASTNLTGAVTGSLAEVKVSDGASVKKGDLIAVLDGRILRATIAKDEAVLAKDQTNLDNVNLNLKRTTNLVAKGFTSTQVGDDATALAKNAQQLVNVDEAILAADQVALSLTEIRAPFDGKLGTILLSPGAFIGTNSVVTTITQMDPVYAEFILPDGDAELMRKAFAEGALSVSVIPQTNKSAKPITGPIVFLDAAIDAASGTLKMRAKLPNSDSSLLIGQGLNVSVMAGTVDNLILVPTVAVTPTASGDAVYVVKDDSTIDVRAVQIALRGDKMIGLSKGLQAGEQVVVEGQVNLSAGTPVKIGAVGKVP